MLQVDRPVRSNYFKYRNDRGKNTSCCAETGHKLFTSPGIADTYTSLMNPWNTLLESYQQRVYNSTLVTVKRQIQQAEKPTPAVVISVEAARVDNPIPLYYLASVVALEEHVIGSTDPNIPIDDDSTDDKLHFGMPGGSRDHEDDGDGSDMPDAIPTASWWRWTTTGLERVDLGSNDVDGYEGNDGHDAYADEDEEASQANDGSTQNVEDWGHSRLDLETSEVDGYECEHGDDVDADEVEEASPADDGLTQNVED